MPKTKLADAARIMEETYYRPDASKIEMQIDIRGVQAVYRKDGILVIPGTNELSDWVDFNFNVVDDDDIHAFATVQGDSGTRWHAGFLEHAQVVYTFAKPLKPRLIVGHSLGAASAQIVGLSLRTPTIAFASPRPHRGRSEERLTGEGFVLNICRRDDAVTYVPPPLLGFRHIGSVYWLAPDGVDKGEDHRIDEYIELMVESPARERLPESWPE